MTLENGVPIETVSRMLGHADIGTTQVYARVTPKKLFEDMDKYIEGGRESLTIGCGMIARGEVALAVYATGQSLIYYENGVLAGIDPLVATIFLIVCSSILCPILLKLVFKNQSQPPMTGSARKVSISSEAIDDNMGDDNVKNASRSAGKKAVTATSVCAIQNPS